VTSSEKLFAKGKDMPASTELKQLL